MRRIRTPAAVLGCVLGLAVPPAVAQHAPAHDAPTFQVERTGHGPPLILIPGMLSGGEVWAGTVMRFRADHELHVLTLGGFAGVHAFAGDAQLAAQRDALIRYIREERLERPVLVGHSLGAFLALSVAAAEPELVGGVVAVDGVPYLPALVNPAATPDALREQAAAIRAMYASFTPEQLTLQTEMALMTMMKSPEQRALGVRWASSSSAATAGAMVAEMLTTDLREAVAAIRAPVLLICATHGMSAAQRERTLAACHAQLARITHARVLSANGARHFVMLDDADFFYRALAAFLEDR